MSGDKGVFKNGYWIWSDVSNGLMFVGRDKEQHIQRLFSGSSAVTTTVDVAFKDTLGSISETNFRKYYRRRVKSSQSDVVILQDVKDVALFACNIELLSMEFICYFHTEAVDRFLRSAIIYFQYFCQVWNNQQLRRTEVKRKLRHPKVIISENIIRDDLADLRSMLSRDYAALLTGIGDAKKFHHMNNQNNVSLSDRDRRLFEVFILMTQRIIWIALKRKYNTLIERELNRLLRSPLFCAPPKTASPSQLLPEENRTLQGKNCKLEQKLLQKSPLVQEIILQNHDYQMLAIGIYSTEGSDPRLEFLEAAYTAPEELLGKLGIGVGILGVPRKYVTSVLKPIEMSTTKKRLSVMKPIPEFCIPRKQQMSMAVPHFFQQNACHYHESEAIKDNRKKQCKLWKDHLRTGGNLLSMAQANLELQSICPSYSNLRTSICSTMYV